MKRKDFIAQFPLFVQQEVKKYQDEITDVNLAIGSLKAEISDTCTSFVNKIHEIHEESRIEDVRIGRLEKAFVDHRKKTDSRLSDCEHTFKRVMAHQELLADKISYCQKTQIDILKKLEASLAFDAHQTKNIENILKHVDGQLNQMKQYVYLSCENTKKEILDIPSEVEPLREEFSKKLKETKVEAAGIMRELAIFKKSLYVATKEIENLNVQIERLKRNKSHKEN